MINKNTLPIEVMAWKYESEKKYNKSKINEFISNFFIEKTYYYSKKQTYLYTMENYREISEDNLLFEILEDYSSKRTTRKKQEIKDIIMGKIKKIILIIVYPNHLLYKQLLIICILLYLK